MPNHVKNKLEIVGTESEVQEVFDFLKGKPYEEDKEYPIDFNNIIFMPEELNITSDGMISLLENQFSFHDSLKEKLDSLVKNDNYKNTLENFIQGIRNYCEHGHASWYGWSIANWGTKWNAYSQKKENNTIIFDTAWSCVLDLIVQISKKYPSVKFNYSYADEDTGNNCGEGYVQNGETKMNYPNKESKEAYELAFKLRPEYKELFKLVDGIYKYVEE